MFAPLCMGSAPREVWHRIRLPPEVPFWLIYATALRSESSWAGKKALFKAGFSFKDPISPYLLKLLFPSLPLAIVPIYLICFENILLFPKRPLHIFQHGCPSNIISGTTLRMRSRAPSWTYAKGRKNKLGQKALLPKIVGKSSFPFACKTPPNNQALTIRALIYYTGPSCCSNTRSPSHILRHQCFRGAHGPMPCYRLL